MGLLNQMNLLNNLINDTHTHTQTLHDKFFNDYYVKQVIKKKKKKKKKTVNHHHHQRKKNAINICLAVGE